MPSNSGKLTAICTGNRRHKIREEIVQIGAKLFEQWGGLAALKACLP
jgi:hypothetical protein